MGNNSVPLIGRIERLAAVGLAKLPAAWLVRMSGRPAVVVDGQTLDPHVQLLLALRRRRGTPGLVEPTLPRARARYLREMRAYAGPKTDVASVRDFAIDGGGGQPMRVRHYAPPSGERQPVTVYLHGGGFAIGGVDSHDEPCRLLCRHARVHVLSVEYRLAPEHPFPAALDDTRAALRWARAHAAELGADPARVAVGGDSAGGNLAAVASRLDTREGLPVAAQLLVYPATDSVTPRPSKALFDRGYFLSGADREAFNRWLVDGTGVPDGDPRVSPLLAPDLGGLPPALVATAGFDLLRDEGEAYAAALQAAGTPARLVRIASQGHGFIHLTGVNPDARRATIRLALDWRALLDAAAG
ncbi:MAG: Acetyl esterase [Gemmatimonadetes bacterium]|nr:Acetyl esterase [Gemmatimonadota bacterium]